MLDSTQLEYFKKVLEVQKMKLLKNLNFSSSEIDFLQETKMKDEGDLASLSGGINVNRSISKRQAMELKEIEKSLNKIKENTYGTCEMCSEFIIIERLEVKPFAEFCIMCREFSESNNHYQVK